MIYIIGCTARIMDGWVGRKTEKRPEVKVIRDEWKQLKYNWLLKDSQCLEMKRFHLQ